MHIDKYQIIGTLGSGHFGQVFHAFDRALQTEKAIKVIKANDPSQFLEHLKEAQILAKCKHKHIVSINEANVFDVSGENRVVLDLEYIPQGSLDSALSKRWVSIRESIGYMRSALQGLEHAHSQGFLHRDIKPGNILLAPSGAKLSDFGLATDGGNALCGSAQGYITHLPPEYFKNSATSAQSDVFAAGMTLFRAVSNISDWKPVLKATPDCRKHVQAGTLIRRIGWAEFIPHQIRRIVNKACHPDPGSRIQSAQSFGQQLDKLRFGIDWIKVNDFSWSGISGADCYEAVVDESLYRITVSKNNRRIVAKCKKFSSLDEAVSALNSYVSSTTLE